MERRTSGRKSGKKRRSFRFNASQNDDLPPWESSAVEEAVNEDLPPPEEPREAAAAPESSAKPPQQPPEPGKPDPKAGANQKVSPRGDSDKSKQQLPPPASPTKRKAARESQPPSPVPASPTARKSQRSPPTPPAEGCPPPGLVSTTKGAATPQGPASGGDSPQTPPADLGSGDSPGEPRKLPRENSKRTALHTELRASKRELEKSTERLAAAAAAASEAARVKSSAVLAPRNTVTSKLHIPGKPKNVDLNLKTKRAESLESVEEIGVEQQINRGNTATKISLFENKSTNQSHRQIDFYATKSIPLTKKFVGRAKLKFGKQAKEPEQVDQSAGKQSSPQKSPEDDRQVGKKLHEIKLKFETAMEVDAVDKAEVGKGTSPRKKGKVGSPQPGQLPKPDFHYFSYSQAVTANLPKGDRQPNTASVQPQQIHQQKNEEIVVKINEQNSELSQITHPPVESNTETGNTSTPAVHEVDSSQVNTLPAEVASSPLSSSSKNSDVSAVEQVRICVETTDSTAKSQDTKTNVKSPTRKGEKSMGKKNDRQKKKQPSGSEGVASPEHLKVQQSTESAEKGTTKDDVSGKPIVERVNKSETIESTSDTESTPVKANVSHGEKTSRSSPDSLTGASKKYPEVNQSVKDQISEENATPFKNEENTLQEMANNHKQIDISFPYQPSISCSEQVATTHGSVTTTPVQQTSTGRVDVDVADGGEARATPGSDMLEFAEDSKEIELKALETSTRNLRRTEIEDKESNAEAEQNKRSVLGANESTKKEIFENCGGAAEDSNESAFVSTRESTHIEQLSCGENKITDIVENEITDLSESAPLTLKQSTKIDLSENTQVSISGIPHASELQDSESPHQSALHKPAAGLTCPEEAGSRLQEASSTGDVAHSASLPCASDSKASNPMEAVTSFIHQLQDSSDVTQSEAKIGSLKIGEVGVNLQTEEKYLPCSVHPEIQSLLPEATEQGDPSAMRVTSPLENISNVQQSKEDMVNLKRKKSEDSLPHVLPVKIEPSDSSADPEHFSRVVPCYDNVPVDGAVPLPNSKDNTQEMFAQKEIELQGHQTDKLEKVPLLNGPDDPGEGKTNTTLQETELQIAKTKTLHESEINSHAHSSKEMEPRDYKQMSLFTEPSRDIIPPNPYSSLANFKIGTQKNEDTFQNGESHAASVEHNLSHNMSFQQHNVSSMMSDLYSTNSHNGSLENGFSFDRPGMFNPRSPGMGFNLSAASDDSSLDSSSEMERFTQIIRHLDSPISLPQKRKKQRRPRSPQPSFGLPPIHEDFLEKIIDSDKFTFGLGKKDRSTDLAPALMLKMQNIDAPSRVRPKRASTDQSFLLKSLRSSNKDVPLANAEVDGKENTVEVTDLVVKRSRLEKSTILSSLKSPLMVTSKDNVFSPTATTISTITTSFATSQEDSTFANPKSFDAIISPQMAPEPEVPQAGIVGQIASQDLIHDRAKNSEVNFANTSPTDFKVPSYMEKYLKTDDEKQAQTLVSVFPISEEGCISLSKTDFEFASAFGDRKNTSGPLESTPKPLLTTLAPLDEEFFNRLVPTNLCETNQTNQILPVYDEETCIENGQEKINPRPGKVVLFGEPNFCGNVVEIYADVPDCTSWELSPVISIKIVRGCWLLYEKPNFEGLSIPLEEGEMELTNLWGEEISEEKGAPLTVIGSLRQVVKDYRICQIDLFTEADGLGLVTSYFDDTEEVQVFDRLQKTCSIKVHWGVWLIYEDAGFQGVPFILEPGEYPNLAFWDTHEAYIGSMRPLKMGGRKVEIPNEPKIFVYEKPFFEGKELELDGEMLNIAEDQIKSGDEKSEEGQSSSFATVSSIRVLGGIWVGYEKPGFEGHQYLLEEGDYPHWHDWGGYNDQLQSFRPIVADFSTSHMIMYSDKDFGEKGANINVLGIISNMEDTGYGLKTQSINVLSGVWVAYENADFTGEQYVLEKGKYSSFEDWGAKSFNVSSVQPIALDAVGSPLGKFKVLLFPEPEFQGIAQVFEENINEIEESFVAKSCKVLAGRWVAFDGVDCTGHQYVLEEGTYPDLCSMGCQENTRFRSLHIIDYEFSEPNLVLYGKQHFKGKKIEFASETVNLQCLGYSARVASVEVLGGIWVIYEYSNYRGRQILLSPDKIPDWYTISGWRTVGSLRPLIQKRVYFKIRNQSTGLFVATNGNLEDLKLLRLQVTEDSGAEDQIWAYHEGFLKCRIAEDCSVAVSGSIVTSGSKLSLTLEEEKSDSQYWSISPEGKIHSRLKPNLVLDIKGGTQYDQKHIILNTISADKETQCWELLVL
ncbi:beta/gamma crystallin domain-containing protein 1 isoform X2 [Lissotriton helveticus]